MKIHEKLDLYEYIFSLKDKRNIAVALCFIAGMTQQETAELLNRSQAYVSKRLKRVKKSYKNEKLSRPYYV